MKIPTRFAAETDEVDAFGNEFFADLTHAIEAANGGDDSRSQPPNRLADEYFRAGHLHDVNDECDPDRPTGRFAHRGRPTPAACRPTQPGPAGTGSRTGGGTAAGVTLMLTIFGVALGAIVSVALRSASI